MLVTFVLDVHPSMGSLVGKPNKCGEGPTQSSAGCQSGWSMLDSAKSFVEQFLHQRGLHLRMLPPNWEQKDDYILVTTEHEGNGIKCGLGAAPGVFGSALKAVEPQSNISDCTSIGAGVGTALRLMNRHRLETDVDHFGRGRLPWLTELGIIVILTNGSRGSTADCSLPSDASSIILAELCSQPFRWDQKICAVITELAVNPSYSLRSLCHSTGGMILCSDPGPQKTNQAVGLLQAAENGNNPNIFDTDKMECSSSIGWATGKDTSSTAKPLKSDSINDEPIHAMLAIPESPGHWPIPEPFWMDYNTDNILPRPTAQPEVFYSHSTMDIRALNNVIELVDHLDIPTDWYELDWCKPAARGGSLQIIGRNMRWPVFVANSDRKGGLGEPFGYLRESPVAGRCILVVLPFNFLHLLPLLQQAHERFQALSNESGLGTGGLGGTGLAFTSNAQLNCLSQGWRQDMSKYLSDMPSYYRSSIYRMLQKFGLQGCVQNFEKGDGLNRKVTNRLSRLRDHYAQENDCIDGVYDCSTSGTGRRMIQQLNQAQGSTGPGKLANDAAMHEGGFNGFTSAAEVPVSRLLQIWEKMRKELFGAGGAAVQGLFSREGTETTCGNFKNVKEFRHSGLEGGMKGGDGEIETKKESKALKHDWTRFGLEPFPQYAFTFHLPHVPGEDNLLRRAEVSCAATLSPHKSIAEMSNYMKVVMERRLPRNPWHDPEPYDETPQGMLLRKLQVNFGNPFRKTGTRRAKSTGRCDRNINASTVAAGEAVDNIIHDDVVPPSPMLDEAIDEASLLYTPPLSPIVQAEFRDIIEQKMDPESDSRESSLTQSSSFSDSNNVRVLPKLVHRKRKRRSSSWSSPQGDVKMWGAPSTPVLPLIALEVPTAAPIATEIKTEAFKDPSSPFPLLNNGLLLPSSAIEGVIEDSTRVLDCLPEEPPIRKGEGQTLPLESTADDTAVMECTNTPPYTMSQQQDSITTSQLLPSEGSSNNKGYPNSACDGIEGGIQPMVVDGDSEGMVNGPTSTICGESCSSSSTAAVGSDLEHRQQQKSQQQQQQTAALSSSSNELLSPSKSQTIPPSSPQLKPQDYELPEGWVLVLSRREQRYYFFNKTTRESIWSPPPGSHLKQMPLTASQHATE